MGHILVGEVLQLKVQYFCSSAVFSVRNCWDFLQSKCSKIFVLPFLSPCTSCAIESSLNIECLMTVTLFYSFQCCFISDNYCYILNFSGRKPSPMWDRLVFNKIKAKLGGRVRFMGSGASPLSPDVMEFLRV